jgi:peptidyl-tRNA hydrolase
MVNFFIKIINSAHASFGIYENIKTNEQKSWLKKYQLSGTPKIALKVDNLPSL